MTRRISNPSTSRHATPRRQVLLLAALSLSLLSNAAAAQTFTVGAIEIDNPWARATPKGASIGGAYMTIVNKGTETDRLVGISTTAADKSEIHQMVMDNGVMSMRPVQGGLEVGGKAGVVHAGVQVGEVPGHAVGAAGRGGGAGGGGHAFGSFRSAGGDGHRHSMARGPGFGKGPR